MDFEKIKTDFEKRYNKPCEKIYFAGQGVELFSDGAKSLSGCVSVGEAIAVTKRADGRITLQFSGTDSMAYFNITEIKRYRDQRFARLLERARAFGVTLGGADIFIFKNSRITDLLEPLTIGGLSAFCEKVPRKDNLLGHFENYKANMITLSGKSKSVTVFDGQRVTHIPFFGGLCKIVITYAGGDFLAIKNQSKSSFSEALLALKKCDMEKFGFLLDRNTENILNSKKYDRQAEIFLAVKNTKDALGSSIMPNGGVFSIVENDKVDRFIQGFSARYQKHFGGEPDFYVTDFVDSGFFAD